MSIEAIVQHDTIKLPPGVHLPDGTRVRVETADPVPGNALAWLKEFAGTVEGPADLAAEHDHYAHGTPKRGQA